MNNTVAPLTGHLPHRLHHGVNGCLNVFLLVYKDVTLASNFLLTTRSVNYLVSSVHSTCAVRSNHIAASFRTAGSRLGTTRSTTNSINNIAFCGGFSVSTVVGGTTNSSNAGQALHACTRHTGISVTSCYRNGRPGTSSRITVSHIFTAGGSLTVNSGIRLRKHACAVYNVVARPSDRTLFLSGSSFAIGAVACNITRIASTNFITLRSTNNTPTCACSFAFTSHSLPATSHVSTRRSVIRTLASTSTHISSLVSTSSGRNVNCTHSSIGNSSVV